jgi:hypothetical protein
MYIHTCVVQGKNKNYRKREREGERERGRERERETAEKEIAKLKVEYIMSPGISSF